MADDLDDNENYGLASPAKDEVTERECTPPRLHKKHSRIKRKPTHKATCPMNPSRRLVFSPKDANSIHTKLGKVRKRKMQSTVSSKTKKRKFQGREIDETGTWVQCTNKVCMKWRYLSHVTDPSQVSEIWTCDMNSDTPYNSCALPEQDYTSLTFVHNEFTEGSIVWAKMQGYPWWPAMIEEDPDTELFLQQDSITGLVTLYHVVFLDKKVTRHWIQAANVQKYNDGECPGPMMLKGHDYRQKILAAKATADKALAKPIKERVKTFGFSATFKGQWGCDYDSSEDVGKEVAVSKSRHPGRRQKVKEPKITKPVKEEREDVGDSIEDILSHSDMEDILDEAEALLGEVQSVVKEIEEEGDQFQFEEDDTMPPSKDQEDPNIHVTKVTTEKKRGRPQKDKPGKDSKIFRELKENEKQHKKDLREQQKQEKKDLKVQQKQEKKKLKEQQKQEKKEQKEKEKQEKKLEREKKRTERKELKITQKKDQPEKEMKKKDEKGEKVKQEGKAPKPKKQKEDLTADELAEKEAKKRAKKEKKRLAKEERKRLKKEMKLKEQEQTDTKDLKNVEGVKTDKISTASCSNGTDTAKVKPSFQKSKKSGFTAPTQQVTTTCQTSASSDKTSTVSKEIGAVFKEIVEDQTEHTSLPTYKTGDFPDVQVCHSDSKHAKKPQKPKFTIKTKDGKSLSDSNSAPGAAPAQNVTDVASPMDDETSVDISKIIEVNKDSDMKGDNDMKQELQDSDPLAFPLSKMMNKDLEMVDQSTNKDDSPQVDLKSQENRLHKDKDGAKPDSQEYFPEPMDWSEPEDPQIVPDHKLPGSITTDFNGNTLEDSDPFEMEQ